MASGNVFKRSAALMGLRGLMMLLGGFYAVFFPGITLAILVVVGGIILLVDGVLGVWGLTFGGAKSGNYWFDVIRNVLAILVGVIILVSPLLSTLITVTLIAYLVAFQAIFIGAMEIFVIVREREMYSKIWPVLLSGAVWVIFGILLLFAPWFGGVVMVVIGGVLAILFSFALFAMAWRMWKAGDRAA